MKVAQAIKYLKEGKIVGFASPLNTWFKLTKKGVWLRWMNWEGRPWTFYGSVADLRRWESDREFTLARYGEQFKEKEIR